MAEYKFHTLDVFTDQRFKGNPLAVVLEADELSGEMMQTIAREFNLSETIFIRQPVDPENTASVRIFFPTAEIPFAGHPTIGSAILLATMHLSGDGDFETLIKLEEVAGLVPVNVVRNMGEVSARFEAPVVPYPVTDTAVDAGLAARALGIDEGRIGFDDHKIAAHEGGPRFLFVPVRDADTLNSVRAIEPYWSEMTEAAGTGGVYIYRRDGQNRYRARMLAPTNGIPEDPATGSASAILASHLLQSGELEAGTNLIHLEQGVEMGRNSEIGLEIDLDGGRITSVRVSGSAVRVSEGTITI